NGNVARSDFRYTTGENLLTAFESSPGKMKYFCSKCGSPMLSTNLDFPDNARVRLGTIQTDITERPGCHIFVKSKANWDNITDDLPQYSELPE
ncbi:MAG: GFA family protein, partial [Gammaproteobacteria bacterium]|nr:GFA family protein [Gammaproteobacteria bacterium]